MRKAAYAGVAAAMIVSCAALGQTPTQNPAAPEKTPPENNSGGMPQPPQQMQRQTKADSANGIRRRVVENLKQAGFQDISVAPESFIVRAKDKSGNPVVMLLDPTSVTEVTEVGPGSQNSGQNSQAAGNDKFADVSSRDELTSRAIGLDVYNPANEDIGAIKDIAFENGDIKAYIIGVGGFLGVGERYVAVQPTAINLIYNADDKKWRAEMDTSKDELKAAPEFKYPSTTH